MLRGWAVILEVAVAADATACRIRCWWCTTQPQTIASRGKAQSRRIFSNY
ncbi:hypothetical protein ACE0DR_08480 [Azotobacter sp. CWF10]